MYYNLNKIPSACTTSRNHLVIFFFFFLSFFNRKPWNSKSSPRLLDRRVAPEECRDDALWDDGLHRWTLRNLQTQNSRLSSSVSATDVKCNLKNLSSDRIWVTLNTGSYSYEPQIWTMRTDGSPSEPQSCSGGLLLLLAAIDWLFKQIWLGVQVLIGPKIGLRSHRGS